MNSILENKLTEYEESTPISNDAELKSAIESILNKENLLPYEERNYELIEEAVDALLELQGTDLNELERYADEIKIGHGPKKSEVKLKWIIPVAAAVALMLSLTVVASSRGHSIWDMAKEAYSAIVDSFSRKDGNNDLIATDGYTKYETLDELREAVPDVLLPENLPDGYEFDLISVGVYEDYKKISILLVYKDVKQTITIKTPDTNDFTADGENVCIVYGYTTKYSQHDNSHRMEFGHNGNYYNISANSYEALTEIIKSMED